MVYFYISIKSIFTKILKYFFYICLYTQNIFIYGLFFFFYGLVKFLKEPYIWHFFEKDIVFANVANIYYLVNVDCSLKMYNLFNFTINVDNNNYIFKLLGNFNDIITVNNFKIIKSGTPDRETLLLLIKENFFRIPDLNTNYPPYITVGMLKLSALYALFEKELVSILTLNQVIYFYIYSILPLEQKFQFCDLFFENIHHIRSYNNSIIFDIYSNFNDINISVQRSVNSTEYIKNHSGEPGWDIDEMLKKSAIDNKANFTKPIGENQLNYSALFFISLGLLCTVVGCITYLDQIKIFL